MAELSIVIVGAGMAGLSAARVLAEHNIRPVLLDKGRGVGGRLATRRVGEATFDHGAQYCTSRDARFQATLDQLCTTGDVLPWASGFPRHNDPAASTGSHTRYRGSDGMNRLAKALAAPHDVRVSTQVSAVRWHDGAWAIDATDLATGAAQPPLRADVVILTAPPEQAHALLRAGNVALPTATSDALRAIAYDPCFAVMLTLDRPSAVPAPGGVFMPGEPLSWLADNQQKGISAAPALTLHAGPQFTRDHYDADHDTVARLLIDAARPYLGDAQPTATQVQRWRYSQPTQLHPEPALLARAPGLLLFAGDGYGGARVEGAALSGMAAAHQALQAVG